MKTVITLKSCLSIAALMSCMFLLSACGGGGGGGGGSDSAPAATNDPEVSKPDLMDSGSYLEQLIPNPVSWGEDFQALCMVGNSSEVDAGPFYIDVYASVNQTFEISNDYFIASQQVPSMPAGGSDVIIIIEPDDMIKFPSSMPSGYYNILYVIDSTNAIDESEEGNNIGLCTNDTLYVYGQEEGGGVEDDHGDDMTHATVVGGNTVTFGDIEEGGDEDYFKITVSSNGTLTIRAANSTGLYGSLYDSYGNLLLETSNLDSPMSRSVLSTLGGTYYVRVRGNSSSVVGKYSLIVSFEEDSEEDDHGNDPLSATAIGENSTTSGNIEVGDDVDIFKITVSSSGTLTVFTTGSTDTYGTLFDSFGNLLVEDQDSGSGSNFSISYSVDSGTYYAGVKGRHTSTVGSYTLASSFEEDAVSDDHGNSRSSATSINENSTTSGSLETGGDNDYFEIIVSSSGTLSVSTTGNTDTYGYLLDSSGGVLIEDDQSGSGNNFSLSYSVNAGTYYVRVKGWVSSTTGSYSVTATFSAVVSSGDYIKTTEEIIPVGNYPFGIAIGGEYTYVSNSLDDSVSVIRSSDWTVVKDIPVGDGPVGIAIWGSYAYVANTGDNSVSVINLSDWTVLEQVIPVGDYPYSIVVKRCGVSSPYVYVTNYGDNSVSVISASDHTVIDTIPVGNGPIDIVISGYDAYVVNRNDNSVSKIKLCLKSLVVEETIPVGKTPVDIVANDWNAYVTNRDDDTVSVISLSNYTVTDIIPVGSSPVGIALLQYYSDQTKANYAYVANMDDDTVSVINLLDNTVVDILSVGSAPIAIEAVSWTDHVYVSNSDDNTVTILSR